MSVRALVIAGTGTGVGKTTVTLGLLEVLRRRGLRVQAFKVGPDFIDPGFHQLLTGRPSYTLDGWMCGQEGVLATVARHAADADLALIEGVMGCFDGVGPTDERGSTAEIAKWLGVPVVLVVDAGAVARSMAAVVLGFERFDPALRIAAVIANRVGGEAHAALVREAVRRSCRAPVVGVLPNDPSIALPERHLGLVTAREGVLGPERRSRLGALVERSVRLDTLLSLAAPLALGAPPAPAGPPAIRARVGVAQDPAFSFYYPENLERLQAAGAELVAWSPLEDRGLPEVDGLYFGGGYPELHAARLAANEPVRRAVAAFAASGRPVYAECGGLMYLAERLEDPEGRLHPMVGLLPATVRLTPPRLTLGYVEVQALVDTPLGLAGTRARGHEFHVSHLEAAEAPFRRAWRVVDPTGAGRDEGFVVGASLLSYVHLHFGSNPALAEHFVSACARAAAR